MSQLNKAQLLTSAKNIATIIYCIDLHEIVQVPLTIETQFRNHYKSKKQTMAYGDDITHKVLHNAVIDFLIWCSESDEDQSPALQTLTEWKRRQ